MAERALGDGQRRLRRERKGGPRKVYASQELEFRQEQSFFLRRKTRRAASLLAEFQGALALPTAGATLFPLCALARLASPGTKRDREERRFKPRAVCLVAASDSWPLIGVTLSAGSRLGPLSDPLESHSCTKASFGSLCGPHGSVAPRTAKRPFGPPRQLS
jgi:hypothetical protein